MVDVKHGYKAFEPGLVCRGKQYAENATFEEKGGEICCAGMMHYCTNPLDVLDYYPLVREDGQISDFAEVTAEEEPITDDGKKYATKKLHIGAKLGLPGLVTAAFSFLWETSEFEENIKNGEKASGDAAQLAAWGDAAKLAASGRYAQLAASSDAAQLAASGDAAKLAASGDAAKLAASGRYAQLAASGRYAQLAASGYAAKLAASGENSVVAGIGINNIAKAALGCWICLAEWQIKDDKYVPVCVKAAQIDGETLKAETYYKLKNGEFVEVEE